MTEIVQTKYCKALVSKIERLRSGGKFCDINVRVDGRVFQCHRLVLSAASEYFDVMFNEKFKSTEVTMRQDIAANVVEEILGFMYTGEIKLRTFDVYDVIRAAQFYKLPSVVELCTLFVEKNLNVMTNKNILKIFSFAQTAATNRQLVQLLAAHIHKNFDRFSKSAEFLELTFDNFMEILNLLGVKQYFGVVQDSFLEAIHAWMSHRQGNLTAAQREAYADRLLAKIDFTKLSFGTRQKAERFTSDLRSSRRSTDGATPSTSTAFHHRSTKLLRAYVSRISPSGSTSTGIFTVNLSSNFPKAPYFMWAYSGEAECCAEFMRNVAIEDRLLYSLRYAKKRPSNDPHQTFVSGSAISMRQPVSLKPPPRILDEFDMCGMDNRIYVYNKYRPLLLYGATSSSYDSIFSQDELSRGLYFYIRPLDKWLPLPRPKSLFDNACMTCDEERVYLIGGSNSHGSVQAYDPRTRGWSALSPTIGTFDEPACCVVEKKIYVTGSHPNSLSLEMYDPTSGAGKNLPSLYRLAGFEKHRLVDWHVPSSKGRADLLCSFNRTLSADSKISFLNLSQNVKWEWMPSLFEAEKNTPNTVTRTKSSNNLRILDMVSF